MPDLDAVLDFLAHGLAPLPWWGSVVVTLALTHVTIAAVTIYLHRCQAHRALDLHPAVSHFFRFWLWLTTGMVTKEWAAIHRKHHAKVETADDPHSPMTRGLSAVLWSGAELYRAESKNTGTIEKYGHGTPDDWMENHIYTPGQKVGIVIMLLIDILCFGIWPGVLIWGIQMIWIPFWAAGVINGLGHYWGYRNFECVDASTNLVPWGILIGGEELHNNHHSFATSAKLSAKWYEFDIGWLYIRILETLGLAKVKKVLPKPKFTELRPAVDLDNLQAVITHRYDVARRYMGSLQSIYREELARLRSSLDSQQVSALKRWFQRDGEVSAQDRASIESALAKSQRLETIYAMRRDLTAVWEKSSASREQLVKQLQDWCHRAEQSGIAQLQEFSLRLRRYAV